jgi:hypothetical protein
VTIKIGGLPPAGLRYGLLLRLVARDEEHRTRIGREFAFCGYEVSVGLQYLDGS